MYNTVYMEVLVLDGKNYVKASVAAQNLGYATDYVGQLCRSGQVDAHLIGRTWYVNQDELTSHRVEKKRMSRIKAREYAKRSIEEQRKKAAERQEIPLKRLHISYESDKSELIPETKKLEVESEPVRTIPSESNVGDSKEVINKGEEIMMSGDVDVVDVTDAPIESDTVILSPSKFKKGSIAQTHEEFGEPETVTRHSFMERLEQTEVQDDDSGYEGASTSSEATVHRSGPLWPYAVGLTSLILFVIATFPLTLNLKYSDGKLNTTFNYAVNETIEKIRLEL
jgi:hypothetical protein